MKIINTTPHTVSLRSQDGTLIAEFPKADLQSRVSSTVQFDDSVSAATGLPCVRHKWTDADSQLPVPSEGTYYIVSTLFADRIRTPRSDLLIPDSGPDSVIRENGQIIGVRRFTIPF